MIASPDSLILHDVGIEKARNLWIEWIQNGARQQEQRCFWQKQSNQQY